VPLSVMTPDAQSSDFVSLHCRLEKNTFGMLGERELKLMKPTAYLINVTRAELIHEEALVAALRKRRIAVPAGRIYHGAAPSH
jgi:D-3-phosphoglycerate dehydrogenase